MKVIDDDDDDDDFEKEICIRGDMYSESPLKSDP